MSTWAKNRAEFLGFLTGFDGRDGFSIRGQLPVGVFATIPGTVGNYDEPPLVAQNDILTLTYAVLRELRKWLRDEHDAEPPTVARLLAAPTVEDLFSKVMGPMFEHVEEATPSADSVRPFVVLRRVLQALVTEAWICRLKETFARELERSLKEFRMHLAQDRARLDDWRDDVDGGVVLYDFFRPNLWKPYRTAWSKWGADLQLIDSLICQLQRLEDAVTEQGRSS